MDKSVEKVKVKRIIVLSNFQDRFLKNLYFKILKNQALRNTEGFTSSNSNSTPFGSCPVGTFGSRDQASGTFGSRTSASAGTFGVHNNASQSPFSSSSLFPPNGSRASHDRTIGGQAGQTHFPKN